ncbi:MAG: class IV adenylate cyclase [Spirochaetaceae bacterium]|nr:MAG: class IV adenylate cyclase [Spirochaetaceae bacterium]
MVEIELKAWVTDPDALRARLSQRCGSAVAYDKRDTYYRAPLASGAFEFRVRRTDEEAVFTRKEKHIEGGLEINREFEFTVSDADALADLVSRLGCTEFAQKRKRGQRFVVDGLTVELSDVAGLGWFVEIEALVADASERPAVEARIRALVTDLEIPEALIEPVPYTTMIADPSTACSRPRGVGHGPTAE